MSIAVGQYTFEGPYTDTTKLEDRSGVYAIHCYRENAYYLVDVGESSTVKTRVENHDRQECWSKHCTGTLTASVLYTPNAQQPGRMQIEQEIRKQYDPPCGKR